MVNMKKMIEDSFSLESFYKNCIEGIRLLVYGKNESIDII